MQHVLRLAFRWVLTLTVVLVFAQLWYLLAWLVTPSGHCDFPEECLNTAYPRAFQSAERLWMLANVAGLATCCVAVAQRSGWHSVMRLGVAWLVAAAAFFVTPWARFDDPEQWTHFADPSSPTVFGGIAWWAVVMLVGSLVLYGWDVIRRLHDAEARELAEAELAAR